MSEEESTLIINESQENWGGTWTEEKLDAFEKYVKAYLTIMKNNATKYGWNLFYFDAFAGSGSRETIVEEVNDSEVKRVLGSDVDGFSFDYYYFVDKVEHSLQALEKKLKSIFPNKANCMAFKPGDANEKIMELVNYAKSVRH